MSVEVEGDGTHEVGAVGGGVGLLETGEDFGARVAVSVAEPDRDYGIARVDGGEHAYRFPAEVVGVAAHTCDTDTRAPAHPRSS